MNNRVLVYSTYEKNMADTVYALLSNDGIKCKLVSARSNIEAAYGASNSNTYEIFVDEKDETRSFELIDAVSQPNDLDLDINSYSDDEIRDIILNPDEWHESFVAKAKSIAKQRNILIEEEEIDSNLSDKGTNYMLPGINRQPSKFPDLADVDTFITKLELIPSDGETAASLQISMKDSVGRVLDNRYFDPTKGEYASDKNVKKFLKVCANLARKFLGEAYTIVEQPTFEAFCGKLISDIGTRYNGVALRTKVVLNNKGFAKLPSYAPIWELSSVPEENSELSINTRFDTIKFEEAPEERTATNLDQLFQTPSIEGGTHSI